MKAIEDVKLQTNTSTVNTVFERIDPTKATKWDEFIKEVA